MAVSEFERVLKTALVTIILAALMAWAGWLTTKITDHCERIAVISKDIADMDQQIKVLFRRHN